MYKKLSAFVFLLVFSLSFALAAPGDSDGSGPGLGTADGTGNSANAIATGNRNATPMNVQARIRAQDGEHMSENGMTFRLRANANSRFMLEANGISADCDCELEQEMVQNRTRLRARLSNGKDAEIKVMPDTASERALERLRLKVCSAENNCTIELKEVGRPDGETRLAYEVQIERHSRILGIFKKKMQVRAQIDSENGEVIRTGKPWWAFLASEPAEE